MFHTKIHGKKPADMLTHDPHPFVTTIVQSLVPLNAREHPSFTFTQKQCIEICSRNHSGFSNQPPRPNTVENLYPHRVYVHSKTAKCNELHELRNSHIHLGSQMPLKHSPLFYSVWIISVANINYELDVLVIISWGHKGQSKLLN